MIDLETHEAVFSWTLPRLAEAGLVKGKTVGIDATTLEANAALRSIALRALATPPIVTATDAPAGTEALPVKWVSIAVPDLGVMRAAIARPSGTGPFPAVLVLHGTHGFARHGV